MKKIFICILAVILIVGCNTNIVYANIGFSQNEMLTEFNWSKYSKKSIDNILDYLEELNQNNEYQLIYHSLKSEIKNIKNFGNEEIHYLYLLKEKLNYELENCILGFDWIYLNLLNQVNKDIEKYNQELEIQRKERIQKELDIFRLEQIDWSNKFMEMFNPNIKFDWRNNPYKIKSINIYDYFSDGQYCAPVENPELTKIINSYTDNHYGIDIDLNEGDLVLSVANNALVEVKDNCVILKLDTNTNLIYKNIQTNLKTGDIVHKKDVIGFYIQFDNSYDGLFFSIIKNNKEYSPVWIMRNIPFITEKGMSMPLFIQFDGLWGGLSYGSGKIGGGGCGPSALAMAISYIKNELVTPPDVVRVCGGGYYIKGVGSSYTLMDKAAEEFGVNVTRIKFDQIIEELKKGHPIVACMGPGEFTKAGHFITLSGIDENGMILVNDSADTIWVRHFEESFDLYTTIKWQGRAFWSVSAR